MRIVEAGVNFPDHCKHYRLECPASQSPVEVKNGDRGSE
jgi:hypothetical protein